MKENYKDYLKALISSIAFLASVVIGFVALIIPPHGVIDSSVLWFTAQMLLFCSALLGVNLSLDNFQQIGHTKKEEKKEVLED